MDEKQMTKGREAYQMMDEACNQLVKSGNWQRVGSSDIKLFLDKYVQALLLARYLRDDLDDYPPFLWK